MFDGVAHGDRERTAACEEVDEGTDMSVEIASQLLLRGRGIVLNHLVEGDKVTKVTRIP